MTKTFHFHYSCTNYSQFSVAECPRQGGGSGRRVIRMLNFLRQSLGCASGLSPSVLAEHGRAVAELGLIRGRHLQDLRPTT